MKRDIAELWIEALESGEYLQGRNQLVHEDDGIRRHCCLGVLCDLAGRAGVADSEDGGGGYFPFHTDGATLPEVVMEWAGVKAGTGVLPREEGSLTRDSLMLRNDDGYTFSQIAQIIRKNVDEL